MPDRAKLETTLKVSFTDPSRLEQALVHSSYCNENPASGSGHNERLEFLGDAVLDIIVAEKLYRDNPDMTEGEMSKCRAALVRRETLARVARSIQLGDYLLLGKGEEGTGGRDKIPNLAGAMEAVIAAVYLDRGFAETRDMVIRLLAEEWEKTGGGSIGTDFKSRLQEVSQSRFQSVPAYRLVGETGPDHDTRFSVKVMINDKVTGSATGKSKKLAENEAARRALENIGEGFTD
ncbi:MAG: ribonuclease III [Dehalococcoidales bacterium]|nr:ribonuclease III [Dehalococcoidales bacterium]